MPPYYDISQTAANVDRIVTTSIKALIRKYEEKTKEKRRSFRRHNNKNGRNVNWGYDSFKAGPVKFTGPRTWGKKFPVANGVQQSPININTRTTRLDFSLPDLQMSYDPSKCATITNSGRSFACSSLEQGTNLTGGPFQHNYRLVQFHVHWGSCDEKGAEHTIDGHQYAAEVHLVHWNTSLYRSFSEAVKGDQGIAVLGVFLKVGKEHSAWRDLMPYFNSIRYRGESCNLQKGFDPSRLLPDNIHDYWTYEGSLTTPPCYESVRFLLFHEAVEVSEEQIKEFRSLSYLPASSNKCCDDNTSHKYKLVDNFRPCMPLNDRLVTSTFMDNLSLSREQIQHVPDRENFL